ncbi:DUF924 domain-containing protein [Microcoleus sp. FACHB-1515]|nr:DUF924 domain-containing protein [Microcoleus sp. FACHB-1515]
MAEIFTFWFGDPEAKSATYADRRKLWFGKNSAVDNEIRDRFLPLHQQAAAGELADWQSSPPGALALLLLLDQFSRNLFRDTPQAFATDPQALAIAEASIAQGFDRAVPPLMRMFFYLPLEHSEDQARQQRSVELFTQLQAEAPELADVLDYAHKHKDVIDRFGRFPHRNEILHRPSTIEEQEFLQQPGSSF